MRFSANIEDKLTHYREHTLVQSSFGQFSTVAGRRTRGATLGLYRRSAKTFALTMLAMALAVLAFASAISNHRSMPQTNFESFTIGGSK